MPIKIDLRFPIDTTDISLRAVVLRDPQPGDKDRVLQQVKDQQANLGRELSAFGCFLVMIGVLSDLPRPALKKLHSSDIREISEQAASAFKQLGFG